MPSHTIDAFLDHGEVDAEALATGTEAAAEDFRLLLQTGIDFEEVCDELLEQGIKSFSKSFQELLDVIRKVTL
jgi:transaldolase